MADDFQPYTLQSLPTPTDTPYRTPSASMSRRSSRRGDHSPLASSSPPPSFNGASDLVNDENISPLDPRRFTPTLHANLVSEILSLRRELDSKSHTIDTLESSLQTSKIELDTVNETLNKTGKETRSLRRQLQLLEGGTSSALGELARERDEAVDGISEVKKRLDASQRKVRSQEEAVDRLQSIWDNDKENWENERRNLERKVHVAEGRMKTVLDEVAAYQESVRSNPTSSGQKELESDADDTRDSGLGHESETASVKSGKTKRPQSSMSVEEPSRFSVLNGMTKSGAGLSLADELNFDEEDEDQFDDESAVSRRTSAIPGKGAHRRLCSDADSVKLRSRQPVYVDAGTQVSPPPSPQLRSVDGAANDEKTGDRISSLKDGRKRVSVLANSYEELAQSRGTASPPPAASSLTNVVAEDPLSPPRTPKSAEAPSTFLPPVMKSASTQTDVIAEPPKRTAPPAPLPIPSIAIHGPTSVPNTPRVGLLPSLTKDVGCQASIETKPKSRSIAIQTEEIQVFNRSIKLPPHLLPSAISSKPPTPEPQRPVTPPHQRRKTAKKNLRARQGASSSATDLTIEKTRPGSGGDSKASKIKRPFRSSSLFTGFDRFDLPTSDDDADEFDEELSDNDFHTKLSAPKHKQRRSKRFSNPPKPVPEDTASEVGSEVQWQLGSHMAVEDKSRGLAEDLSRPFAMSKSTSLPIQRPETSRRIVSAGPKSNARRGRSPSLDEIEVVAGVLKQPVPPYPVPTRSSSRKLPFSYSDGTRSPSNGSASILSSYRHQGSTSRVTRNGSLRKVRSAAALPRHGRADARAGSRSPPPLSISSAIPDSPQLPPMPRNEVTDPRSLRGLKTSHKQQASTNTSNTGGASVSSYSNQVSVVDAIAQTMVGEWMWKYVRRRKSFGVPDSPQPNWEVGAKNHEEISANITGNGVRHKRWVWLAPYERAVMWSSRQPTSGSALLGKSGRKLAIQSVLDVKDDTPAPKGSGPVPLFNRSILILTPARALKFTAPTKERHYVWLTALSFLSHSSLGMSDLAQLPSPTSAGPLSPSNLDSLFPRSPIAAPPPPPIASSANSSVAVTGLRRNPVRDSIRIAKGKKGPLPSVPALSSTTTGPDVQEIDFTHGVADEGSYLGAAEPPTVPRFSAQTHHGRKRSNTGPRQKSSGFRALSSPITTTTATNSSYGYPHIPGLSSTMSTSVGTFPSTSELAGHHGSPLPPSHPPPPPPVGRHINGGGLHSEQSSISLGVPSRHHRNSEASTSSNGNFFDAVGGSGGMPTAMGTVRMEAFVQQANGLGGGGGLMSGSEYMGPHSSRSARLRGYGQKRGGHDGTWAGAAAAAAAAVREDEGGWGDDPFRGF